MIDAVQLLAGIEDIPQREIEDVVSRRVRYFRKNVLDVRLCDWIDVRDLLAVCVHVPFAATATQTGNGNTPRFSSAVGKVPWNDP